MKYTKGFSTTVVVFTVVAVGFIGGATFHYFDSKNTQDAGSMESVSDPEMSETEVGKQKSNFVRPVILSHTSSALFGDTITIVGEGFEGDVVVLLRGTGEPSGQGNTRVIPVQSQVSSISFAFPKEALNERGESTTLSPGRFIVWVKANGVLSNHEFITISDHVELAIHEPTESESWVLGEPHRIWWFDSLSTRDDKTKYNLYLLDNFGNRFGTIAENVPGPSYIWITGEIKETNLKVLPSSYRLQVEKQHNQYPATAKSPNPLGILSPETEDPIIVDLKVNGGNSSVKAHRGEELVVTWTSENVNYCNAFGSTMPFKDGGAWNTEGGDLLANQGSKTILARDINISDKDTLAVWIACYNFRSDGETRIIVRDEISIFLKE